MNNVQDFRIDDKVKQCAQQHIKNFTFMSEVARNLVGICTIGLEARYHGSCYKAFARISYSSKFR